TWDFNYAFHYSATSDYARYDRLTNLRNGLPRSAEWKYGPQIWMMNHFTLVQRSTWKSYDELTIRLAHQYFEESRIDRNFNSDERLHRIEKVNAYSANFDFAKKITEKHQFYYGLEFVLNDVESIGIDEDIRKNTKVAGPARY